ncbi:MAG: L,D-transpeptidase family protein [Myxococcota bacterium]|nr:L,D-transpeptidase family protein [Myxococcota bacterium]
MPEKIGVYPTASLTSHRSESATRGRKAVTSLRRASLETEGDALRRAPSETEEDVPTKSHVQRTRVAAAPAEVWVPTGRTGELHAGAVPKLAASGREQQTKRPRAPGQHIERALAGRHHARYIRALYDRLGGDLLFHQDGVLTGTGRSVLALLQDVASHGLSPADYGVAAYRDEDSEDVSREAARDVALAYGVLRYVGDFNYALWAHPFQTTRSWAELLENSGDDIVAFAAEMFPSVDVGLKDLWPTDPLYAKVRKALPVFQSKLPGWRQQPALSWRWKNFEPGDVHWLIGDYQRRLAFDGYYTGPMNRTLDEETIRAVKAFQKDHGMVEDGQPGKTTNWRMKTTRRDRVNQLRATLFHLRESQSRRDRATTFVRVNVAGADMQLFEDGRLVREHRVVVGNNDLEGNRQRWRQGHLNRTPVMKTRLYEVVLNPVWIVPKRIKTGEFAGKSAGYLQSKGIHAKGDVLVQSAGAHNVLGRVKFLLERTNAIYMHDTNRPHLFETDDRYRSHGCMRVSEALGLARHILTKSGQLTDTSFDAVLAAGKRKKFALEKPIDVYVEYVATGLDDSGRLVFHPDVYGYDAAFAQGKLPRRGNVRWGANALRPRGVPQIPFRAYESLYAAGGLAPLTWPAPTSD